MLVIELLGFIGFAAFNPINSMNPINPINYLISFLFKNRITGLTVLGEVQADALILFGGAQAHYGVKDL